ncbi:MAG: cytochrome P450 [Alphaproteobacteria bacterium]|nr:cytochrome P450 [Alphaproteobacteria bacterium]
MDRETPTAARSAGKPSCPFDSTAPGFAADPYPTYRRLREHAPIVWSEELKGWLVTGYDTAQQVLKHDHASVEKLAPYMAHISEEERREVAPVNRLLADWMVFNDPPRHSRLRATFGRAFLPHEVERMRPRVRRVVSGLIDVLKGREEIEFIRDFAFPLPAYVITDLFGIAQREAPLLRDWSNDLARFVFRAPASRERNRRASAAAVEMSAFFRRHVEARRGQPPQGDLMDLLLQASEGPDALSLDELNATLVFLLFAGHETTMNLLANGLYWLLRRPAAMARLKAEPALVTRAVEEFLRFEGPAHTMVRLAAVDFAVAGQAIAKGERLFISLGAADRDPARFADAENLDIARRGNQHIAFGFGIHFCLGAPLARLEAQEAFGQLLRRFASFEMTGGEPEWHEGLVVRGMRSLPLKVRIAD